ncbi:hypothetical protein [Tumebacillus lipolyticus]|uniref:Uncharacterized protein n=1 Tax=Tumebacillus lipolyticus TaxID=1280370 RepID=A0ABW4ZWG2_9BACL
MYDIIDVTQWKRSEESASGSKDKEWRICPSTGRYGLVKKPGLLFGGKQRSAKASYWGSLVGKNSLE